MRSWRRHPTRASTPSPARGWPRRWRAPGRRRPGQLALLRGQGGPRVLRDLRPQPARRGGDRRREAPSRAVGRRHRPPSRKRLFPRQDGPGEPDQGVRNSVHHRPLDPVLRVPRPHRRIRRRRRRHSAVACPSAADRIGRRGRCDGRRHARRTGERHRSRSPAPSPGLSTSSHGSF